MKSRIVVSGFDFCNPAALKHAGCQGFYIQDKRLFRWKTRGEWSNGFWIEYKYPMWRLKEVMKEMNLSPEDVYDPEGWLPRLGIKV